MVTTAAEQFTLKEGLTALPVTQPIRRLGKLATKGVLAAGKGLVAFKDSAVEAAHSTVDYLRQNKVAVAKRIIGPVVMSASLAVAGLGLFQAAEHVVHGNANFNKEFSASLNASLHERPVVQTDNYQESSGAGLAAGGMVSFFAGAGFAAVEGRSRRRSSRQDCVREGYLERRERDDLFPSLTDIILGERQCRPGSIERAADCVTNGVVAVVEHTGNAVRDYRTYRAVQKVWLAQEALDAQPSETTFDPKATELPSFIPATDAERVNVLLEPIPTEQPGVYQSKTSVAYTGHAIAA